jgi:hypothetical protein
VKLNIVPARTGVQWVKLGVQTFFKQPLALAGLFFMYMAAVLVLTQLPVIGVLLGGMMVPAATLGLMAATEEATKGRFPMPSVLLSAFRAGRQRVRAMLVLGVAYTVASMLVTALAGLLAGNPAPIPSPPAGGAETAPAMDAGVLVALVLHVPLFVLFWHAPALVHWHGVSPGKSLFFSAVACMRNLGAFLMYGATWAGVFLAVAFVMGTLGLMLGGNAVARSVMMPVALLMAAMFSTSIYFTFRDSFVAESPSEAPELPVTDNNPPGGDER